MRPKSIPPLYLVAVDGTRTRLGLCESFVPDPRRERCSLNVIATDGERVALLEAANAERLTLCIPFPGTHVENIITGFMVSVGMKAPTADNRVVHMVDLANATMFVRSVAGE